MKGRVTEFDDPRGIGVVSGDDGVEYRLHCAELADGSRTVEVGAEVAFSVRPGHLGRWEAVDVRSCG